MNLISTVFITTTSFKAGNLIYQQTVGTPSLLCQLLHGRALQGAGDVSPSSPVEINQAHELVSLQLRNKQHSPPGHLFWNIFQHYKGGFKPMFVSEKLLSLSAIDSRCQIAWMDNIYKNNLFKTNNSFSTKWLFFLFTEQAPTFQSMAFFRTFETVNSKYIFLE